MNHFLSIQELNAEQIVGLVDLAANLKANRGKPGQARPLEDQVWGIMFSK